MAERCNCDASCGENRYHDAGDPGCRFSGDDEYLAYWDRERSPHGNAKGMKKEDRMAKVSVKGKLANVNESWTVNMYDNGYMVEVGGRDKKGDYKTSKLMLGSVDELIEVIKEITSMERAD